MPSIMQSSTPTKTKTNPSDHYRYISLFFGPFRATNTVPVPPRERFHPSFSPRFFRVILWWHPLPIARGLGGGDAKMGPYDRYGVIKLYHQTFQVPKMEVLTYTSSMFFHPKNSLIRIRKPSILGT